MEDVEWISERHSIGSWLSIQNCIEFVSWNSRRANLNDIVSACLLRLNKGKSELYELPRSHPMRASCCPKWRNERSRRENMKGPTYVESKARNLNSSYTIVAFRRLYYFRPENNDKISHWKIGFGKRELKATSFRRSINRWRSCHGCFN